MAAPTNLPRLDPPLGYEALPEELQRWLSNVVDAFNQAMEQIENP